MMQNKPTKKKKIHKQDNNENINKETKKAICSVLLRFAQNSQFGTYNDGEGDIIYEQGDLGDAREFTAV